MTREAGGAERTAVPVRDEELLPGRPRVAIVVGSRSDVPILERAAALLDELGLPNELRVISAHRAPRLLDEYIEQAQDRGIEVFIAAAGLAAHLPGAIASRTPLPVIGVPMPGELAGGLDALLSIVQMPRGVPVATVGVGNAENAALLAAQILALKDGNVRDRIVGYRAAQTQAVASDPSNREERAAELTAGSR
jgi:phosphoribosylaminoimidazole carboxylase PurE protein